MNVQLDSERSGWLLYHSVGVFPDQQTKVNAALEAFIYNWYQPALHRWEYGLDARQQVIGQWAHLINAPEHTVFVAESVTEVFARFIGALGRKRLAGRRVLITADCFPSLHFMLSGLSETLGYTLETVPISQNAAYVKDDDFIDCWKDDVALAVLTWVTSTTSKKVDLARLTKQGRAQGSLIAVDITQGVGILDFDVNEPKVDFVASTTLKWLCGSPGSGFAYVDPKLLNDQLIPLVQGWFSQPDPMSWDLDNFKLATDARRFNVGTPSILPYIASKPGIDWCLSSDRKYMREHNLRLSHQILSICEAKDYRVLSPLSDSERGGSVMVQLPISVDPIKLEVALAKEGILVDTRGRILRMSPGVLTTESALNSLAVLLP